LRLLQAQVLWRPCRYTFAPPRGDETDIGENLWDRARPWDQGWEDRHKEVLALLLCCLFGQTYCNAECARFLCVCYCIVPQVVAELRKRAAAAVVVAVKNKSDEEAKLAGRAAAQSPQQKEAAKAFCIVSAEEVTDAWGTAMASAALPLCLADKPHFRNAVELTAK
jgi:hypothetical protein